MSDIVIDTPATGAPVAPAAEPSTPAPQAVTQPVSPAPASPEPPAWLPARLKEERDRAIRQYESQVVARKDAEYNARYGELERKYNALAGVTPPPDPQVQSVRQQFSQLYPGLAQLEEHANDLLAIRAQAGDLQAQTQHYWQSHGRQTMDNLYRHAAESMGAPLTNDGKNVLHNAFVGYVQSSPELAQRYASDPSIVEDFWKSFTSTFIDPVRRAASATVAGRVPGALPQDTPGGAPQATPAPKLNGLDERVAAGWNQYTNTAKKSHF